MTDNKSSEIKFYHEIEELARYIRQAKEDIARIKPKTIDTDYIPVMTGELDGILGTTEEATHKILDVCDEMNRMAEGCSKEVKLSLIAGTTRIFEACSFQDITGQRISKVVETLKHIDSRIEALLKTGGGGFHRDEKRETPKPPLPQNAMRQDEIDRLMSE